MDDEFLASEFENHRSHLRSVAYRMLGSADEADDAVQEAWLRLHRSDADAIDNLGGWLTTVVARVSLNMLQSRRTRREAPLDDAGGFAGDLAVGSLPVQPLHGQEAAHPEREAVLADSVGMALLVVLDVLTPAERLAFVLHDLFAMPFDEIAPIVERSPAATRQLASRARRRVQGGSPDAEDRLRKERVVDAFLTASREGDFAALLTLLDPEVVLRADAAADQMGTQAGRTGAQAVAEFFSGRARAAQVALIDDAPGLVWMHKGEVKVVFEFAIERGQVVGITLRADPEFIARATFS